MKSLNLPVRRYFLASVIAASLVLSLAGPSFAQSPPPYGLAINEEQAAVVLKAAKAEANKNEWPVTIAIVDGSGFLVSLLRLDNCQLASVEVAQEKARSSALFRRPTKAFEDTLAKGGANLKVLRLPQSSPLEGGLPIIIDGKVIGAIGVSGATSEQDSQIGTAGINALIEHFKNSAAK